MNIILALAVLLVIGPVSQVVAQSIPSTPFESSKNFQIPSSKEVSGYLRTLADISPHARLKQLGISEGQRPINILFISQSQAFLNSGKSTAETPTVMLIGSQHGNEPSGAEALQVLAKKLLSGAHPALFQQLNFAIIALANPDGRDLNTRYNAARTNPNVDYIAASAKETRIFINALHDIQPHVVYDIHESGVFKRVLSKEQGYTTDVHAQFEVGNNPNIYSPLRQYSEKIFLPALVNAVNQAGLAATRYRGEITHLQQPVARGGIGLSNLRNYAAMQGALSVLVENRLDKKGGNYPTPRNIEQRVDKQYTSVIRFLSLVAVDSKKILALTDQTKKHSWKTEAGKTLFMELAFANNPKQKKVNIPLIEMKTGRQVFKTFQNNDLITAGRVTTLPERYLVTAETAMIARLLDTHRIHYRTVSKPSTVRIKQWRIKSLQIDENHKPGISDWMDVETEEKTIQVTTKAGDLIVPTDQLMGRFAALLLDPASSTSVFQRQEYREFLVKYPYFFISPLL